MAEYNIKDIFIQRKSASGGFEEHPLAVSPNSVIVTDASNNLKMISTSSLLAGTGSIDHADSASVAISSSYAQTASYALNAGSGGTTLTTGSTYPITASWSNNSITASYALNGGGSGTSLETGSQYPITSSWAVSASWAPTLYSLIQMKSGIVSGSVFGGTPLSSSVIFDSIFPTINYSVLISGEDPRTYSVESKTTGSFIINSNSSVALSNYVYWQAINVTLTSENTASAIPLKSGIVNGSLFGGSPLTASITFTSTFINNNYTILISGGPARIFTVENKSTTGFTINSNSSTIFIEDVYWQAVEIGEYN